MQVSETTDEVARLAARFRSEVLEPTKSRLVGKDEVIELLGVALAAGENLFLLGPPGTAKSAVVHEFAARLGGRVFDYLLTRFTEPSELFGPFDLRRLRDGDLVTNTEGMLPEADFVFLDELLNANSAILNSLLLALNERVFRRGRERRGLPMLLAVGASNRLPEDEALAALFDRFLLRVTCDNVPDDALRQVLDAGWAREATPATAAEGLDVEAVRAMQQWVARVDLSAVAEPYLRLVRRLREVGLPLSDRRAVKLQRVVAAAAVLCGRVAAVPSDLWVMRYIWDTRQQAEVLAAQVEAITADAGADGDTTAAHPLAQRRCGPDPERLLAALEEIGGVARGDGHNGAAEGQRPAAVSRAEDRLTLLSARLEWVEDATAREDLQRRAEAVRRELQQMRDEPRDG